LETQKKADTIISVRKKWVAAAMIALASGSTVLLTSNTANAATSDSNAEVQVTAQNQNTTENKTQARDTANSHDTEQNVTVQANSSQQSNQEANTADQNNTPENDNQVQTPTNQADHVKGNVQSAWDQGYKGQGTVVAVIDSGADPSHKDFQTMPENPKLSKDDIQKRLNSRGMGSTQMKSSSMFITVAIETMITSLLMTLTQVILLMVNAFQVSLLLMENQMVIKNTLSVLLQKRN